MLVLSPMQIVFDVSAENAFWKHFDIMRNCSFWADSPLVTMFTVFIKLLAAYYVIWLIPFVCIFSFFFCIYINIFKYQNNIFKHSERQKSRQKNTSNCNMSNAPTQNGTRLEQHVSKESFIPFSREIRNPKYSTTLSTYVLKEKEEGRGPLVSW